MRENLTSLAQGRVALLALADSRLSQLLANPNDLVQRIQHTQVFMLRLCLVIWTRPYWHWTALACGAKPCLMWKTAKPCQPCRRMDSCLLVYQEVIEPLNSAHQERLFEETMLMAQVMGIPENRRPADWHVYRRWWQRRYSGPVSDRRRQLGHDLIREQGYLGRLPYGQYLPFQIPEFLRQTFRLPQTGLDSHRAYQKHLKKLMDITRRLPPRLRYQPAHEASQRLGGGPVLTSPPGCSIDGGQEKVIW